jgi:hypothetical protein
MELKEQDHPEAKIKLLTPLFISGLVIFIATSILFSLDSIEDIIHAGGNKGDAVLCGLALVLLLGFFISFRGLTSWLNQQSSIVKLLARLGICLICVLTFPSVGSGVGLLGVIGTYGLSLFGGSGSGSGSGSGGGGCGGCGGGCGGGG